MKESENTISQVGKNADEKIEQQQTDIQENPANEEDAQPKSWIELLLSKLLGKDYEDQVSYNSETGLYSVKISGASNNLAKAIEGLNQMFAQDTKDAEEEKYFDNLFLGIEDARSTGNWPSMSDILKNPDSLKEQMEGIRQKAREGAGKSAQKTGEKDVTENDRNAGNREEGHFAKMVGRRSSGAAAVVR